MYEFKDPTPATRLASGTLLFYLAANAALAAILLVRLLDLPPPLAAVSGLEVVETVGVAVVLSTLACWILVGRWIYRVSANAHALSAEMTITPGWAVGFYFVPIANLFKPYQALKETWHGSHFGGEGEGAGLLPLWWGLWLVGSFLGRMRGFGADAALGWFDLAGPVVDIVLTLVLIEIMRRLVRAQRSAFSAEVFA